ncbi:nucleotidyltransferase domain-containing protein [Paenibacillus allorhizosphaerae]|uniref:Polymerase beta nucleotidyltransferase domain-containing protein n=1 Tax=Paenibacillus allorhizosphaerae TaxID=2849866 RepID=A0ABM8VRW8_9BACL|nr:nucleotidyltransferase domain-containing protein [Paenibacillus allorhizosphaerae]CAG7655829.1 hypothetical protein PAECIP111802_06220 [Paenibacillus allorhizosphaerae]
MERHPSNTMKALFVQALESFVDKLKKDDQVIAAILMGSLSYDEVWEKSDIDLKLIVHEQKLVKRYMCFMENGIPINASIDSRNDFKRWVEKSIQGSVSHSMLVRSTLLFAKEESIEEYFADIRYVGERDRQLQLLQLGCFLLGNLAKAEKWLYVKRDFTYSAFWMIKMIDVLARIEVIVNKEVPMREAVQQAAVYNPVFFGRVYTDLVNGAVHEEKAETSLRHIRDYIELHTEKLFKPILDYLKQEADVRSLTEMTDKLGAVIHLDGGMLFTACDWLAERGFIMKIPVSVGATPKSRVALEEPAYMYEDDEME